MKNVKKLFQPKRPGRRAKKQLIPYHEDRRQREQWKHERIHWDNHIRYMSI